MQKITRYTKEKAQEIININVDIKTEYNQLVKDYNNNELDCSLFSCELHNLEEDPTKVVVQFISDEKTDCTCYIDDEDGTIYNTLITDSLEEAVVIACLEV